MCIRTCMYAWCSTYVNKNSTQYIRIVRMYLHINYVINIITLIMHTHTYFHPDNDFLFVHSKSKIQCP